MVQRLETSRRLRSRHCDRSTRGSGGFAETCYETARQVADAWLIAYVGSRTIERGRREVDEIRGAARLIILDVADAAAIAEANALVEELDVLLNNAGIMVGRAGRDRCGRQQPPPELPANVFGVATGTNAFSDGICAVPAIRASSTSGAVPDRRSPRGGRAVPREESAARPVVREQRERTARAAASAESLPPPTGRRRRHLNPPSRSTRSPPDCTYPAAASSNTPDGTVFGPRPTSPGAGSDGKD